MDYRS